MKGDFSRDTFDATRHFSRVLMQQGRVQLDADANEQTAILLHYLQTLAKDLIGEHGGPGKVDGTPGDGFKITPLLDANNRPVTNDFAIVKGHYYVDGILCENDSDTARYTKQADYVLKSGTSLVYLDVWERHLTYLEVEDADGSVISIREVALNGPDTATRAQVVWQVRTTNKLPDDTDIPSSTPAGGWRGWAESKWQTWVSQWQPTNRGQLKARAIQPASPPDDPCTIPPDARYRGAENQLYRVEVHLAGTADGAPKATFKWSRENGSVIFPIRRIADLKVTLEGLGRDTRLGLRAGDWVEIVDDDYTLQNRVDPLLEVDAIDYDNNVVTLKATPDSSVGRDTTKHPLLRRWDQRASDTSIATKDGVAIVEGDTDQYWIELEDGIQIQFQPGGTYRTGDYWLIPARTATGDVEWLGPAGAPLALGPRGIDHHFAPLWIISVAAGGAVTADNQNDLRRTITPLWLLKKPANP